MLALSKTTPAALLSGEFVVGHAWPEGSTEQISAVLTWDEENGAKLTLVEPTDAWSTQLGSGPHVIHMSANIGERFTLLDAFATHSVLDGRISSFDARTLGLGAHMLPAELWSNAEYSTANVIEWRAATGLSVSSRTGDLRIEWTAPEPIEVQLPDARLVFAGEQTQNTGAFSPMWSIDTSHVMHVTTQTAGTIDEMHRLYAQPLVAFTMFALDQPDTLSRELLSTPKDKRSVLVWRAGPKLQPKPWHHGHGFLFRAADLSHPADALAKWWRLHADTWPALGLFAQHLNDGSSFSPARLITLHTALEAYGRAHLNSEKLKKLRDHAGVPSSVTGCTNDALDLLGWCRGYFAHVNDNSQRFTPLDAEHGAVPSTRRASALMQACLLRDIGLDATTTERLLTAHYMNWPLP